MRTLIRFLLSAAAAALLLPPYLAWGSSEAEGQIDKMQRAVHFTPGAEPPLPPRVLLAGAGLVVGHHVLARALGLRFWGATFSFVAGAAAVLGLRLLETQE